MPNYRNIGPALILLGLASAAYADNHAAILIDVDTGVIDGAFMAGDVVTVTVSAVSDRAAIYSMSCRLRCDSYALAISDIQPLAALPILLDGSRLGQSGSAMQAVFSQPLSGFDPTLGADGVPVPVATIWIEVLQDDLTELVLVSDFNLGLLGRRPGTIQLRSAGPNARITRREGRWAISICNPCSQPPGDGGTRPPTDDAPLFEPWTVELATLNFDVRPVGHPQPVSVLQAYTQYELHYRAGSAAVVGYVLFVVSAFPEESIATATPPGIGHWSQPNTFVHLYTPGDEPPRAAQDYVDGYYKYDFVADDLWPCPSACAAPQGHLLNFTTDSPGTLFLELIMYQDDQETRSTVEMFAEAQFQIID